MDEASLVRNIAFALIGIAVVPLLALLNGFVATYGRYSTESPWYYGFLVSGKVAWVVQESPCLLIPLILLYYGNKECLHSLPNMILLGLYLFHYVQRTLIFPFLIRGGKPTPIFLMLIAFAFTTLNSYLQARNLTYLQVYPSSYLYDIRFLAGIVIFFTGMYINLQSDSILRNLRKPGDTGYKIPKGGMFEYVSGANFFGEILEWSGFALASWSWMGLAIAIVTICNIGPRGYHHHQWYLNKFKGEYPKHRKAVIPFLW